MGVRVGFFLCVCVCSLGAGEGDYCSLSMVFHKLLATIYFIGSSFPFPYRLFTLCYLYLSDLASGYGNALALTIFKDMEVFT